MSTLPAPAPVGIHRFVTRAVPLTSSVVTGVVVPIPTSPEVVTWKNEFNGIRRPSVGTELAERHTSPWNDVSRIALLHALVVAETGYRAGGRSVVSGGRPRSCLASSTVGGTSSVAE